MAPVAGAASFFDGGEMVAGVSSELGLIGSFQGRASGDLDLSPDVPIFG